MATKPTLVLDYNDRVNTRDLRTVETTEKTPSFIVDCKLINLLMSKLTITTFLEAKNSMMNIIKESDSMPEVMERMEEFFYIYKIGGKLAELEMQDRPAEFRHDDTFGSSRKEPAGAVVID